MDLKAKIILDSLDIRLNGSNTIIATIGFEVCGYKHSFNNNIKVSLPLPEELKQYINNNIIPLLGEKVQETYKEGDD